MIINKSSWHYRFLQKMGVWDMPTTLCSYFWTLVAQIFLASLFGSLASLFTIGYPILAWSAFHNHSHQALNGFIIIVMAPTILGITFGVLYLHEKFEQRVNKKTEPNILIEMIKATKNKVCPLITYKDAS